MKITRLLLLLTLCALTSCAVPDPLYTANASRITDTEYPQNKLVGTWASMIVSPVQTSQLEIECKTYYEFSSGGRGRLRQVLFNKAIPGKKMTIEGPLRWHYEGRNYWRITIPSTDQCRVTSNNTHWTKGTGPGRQTSFRYHEGNFYEHSTGRVWVPASYTNVKAMAERQRSIAPLLRVTLPY